MIKIYSKDETIDILLNSNKSICRLGDGELKIITDLNYNIGFQKNSENLRDRLKSILLDYDKNDNILVSVAFLEESNYILGDRKDLLIKLINKENKDYTYGSANITRILKYINLLKEIWKDKEIIVIEGKFTRCGVGNDLFNNVRSVERILCPAKDAFDKYEEIINYVTDNISRDKLILCSLGPTATVLSYELSKLGYRILDTGHFDIIYEWRKIGPDKYIINGKYVNEVTGGNDTDKIGDCLDEEYNNQIIKII